MLVEYLAVLGRNVDTTIALSQQKRIIDSLTHGGLWTVVVVGPPVADGERDKEMCMELRGVEDNTTTQLRKRVFVQASRGDASFYAKLVRGGKIRAGYFFNVNTVPLFDPL